VNASGRAAGVLMVVVAAATFGTIPILAKLAYASGLSPLQTLTYRFAIAASGLLVLAALAGHRPLRLRPAHLAQLFGLGVVGYAGMAACFFVALGSLPASLVELMAYVYPSLVTVGAWRLFGRPITRQVVVALAVSFAGLALLVGGVRLQAGLPLVFAVAAPVIYASYILAGEHLVRDTSALVASAIIHAGAAVSFVTALVVTGPRTLPSGTVSWTLLLALALGPSMLGISLLLGGLRRVGAGHAALLGTFEPVVTVVLAAALLGDRLTPLQLAGGAAMLAAVASVRRRPVVRNVPAAPPGG
jgi:drug/metabolite transporter (DMT)-like permease